MCIFRMSKSVSESTHSRRAPAKLRRWQHDVAVCRKKNREPTHSWKCLPVPRFGAFVPFWAIFRRYYYTKLCCQSGSKKQEKTASPRSRRLTARQVLVGLSVLRVEIQAASSQPAGVGNPFQRTCSLLESTRPAKPTCITRTSFLFKIYSSARDRTRAD